MGDAIKLGIIICDRYRHVPAASACGHYATAKGHLSGTKEKTKNWSGLPPATAARGGTLSTCRRK